MIKTEIRYDNCVVVTLENGKDITTAAWWLHLYDRMEDGQCFTISYTLFFDKPTAKQIRQYKKSILTKRNQMTKRLIAQHEAQSDENYSL